MQQSFITILGICLSLQLTISTEAKTFNVSDIENDLNYLVNILDQIHPAPWRYISRDSFLTLKENLCKDLPSEEFIREEVAIRAARLLASIGDAHTSAHISFSNKSTDTVQMFPLSIIISNDKVYISKNYSDSNLPIGAEIMSVNSIPVNILLQTISQYISYDTKLWQDHMIESNFWKWLYLTFGFEGKFKIEVRDSLAHEKMYELTGVSYNKFINQNSGPVPMEHFRDIQDTLISPSTMLLTINTMRLQNTGSYYSDLFKRINDAGISNLIIDVRNNGGGGDNSWEPLAAHLMQDSVKMIDSITEKFGRFKWKLERKELSFKNRRKYKSSDRPVNSKNSVTITTKWKTELLQKVEYPFNGKVYLLTSSNTFSSATNLASFIKRQNLGSIVGEQTGNVANHCGNILRFYLPKSKIPCSVSRRLFRWLPEKYDKTGVLPDWQIKLSPADILDADDEVLEKVINCIEKNGPCDEMDPNPQLQYGPQMQ